MSVDEFLRQTEELADEREGASPHRVYKLLALVRKLREQRDSAFEDLWRERGDGWLGEHHEQATEKANAALDEIVRGG